MARLIPAGRVEMLELLPSKGESFTLEELQRAVGGYIEAIQVRDPNGAWLIMIVNEDGRSLGLPYNPLASQMAQREIVGDVVLCKRPEMGE